MPTIASILSLAFISINVAIQAVFVFLYMRVLRSAVTSSIHKEMTVDALPLKAAVVMSVRGKDPFLKQNLTALLNQGYTNFSVFIVVDSQQDSAWPDVLSAQTLAPDRIHVSFLKNPLTSCSLKCSSLAEAIESLDESYEAVAFIDGDAHPYLNWLSDLLEPLQDRNVGVVTGNRWYAPSQATWGSLVRYFWNAGAIVQVWLNGITWGGSMAMRTDVIKEIGLVDALRHSFFDDAAVVRQTRKHGYRTVFAPSVMMANCEEIDLSSFITWSERQMIAARSSDAGRVMVAIHAFCILACISMPFLSMFMGIWANDGMAIGLSAAAIAVYWIAALLFTLGIDQKVQGIFRKNGVEAEWGSWRTKLRFLPALVLSHFVYFRVLIGARMRTRVSWRGVEYLLLPKDAVRMLEYRPFLDQSTTKVPESIL